MIRGNLLYIGLNGLAGSGKDTIAKMLNVILGHSWKSIEDAKSYYDNIYTNPTIIATFNNIHENEPSRCMLIAYADQLKYICASMFGIPVSRFYLNKSNAWVCITDKFEYTEIEPSYNVVTCEEFYNKSLSLDNQEKYWMSLRDILVYVGTYILQQNINKQIFVNIVRNKIHEAQTENDELDYVVVTDNRFPHELDFIKENYGVTINIIRPEVKQLDNIAEHSLDDQEYDFTIINDGTYDELFEQVWNLVHDNKIFQNVTFELDTRDNTKNYLRMVDEEKWVLCPEYRLSRVSHKDGEIVMVDPSGGPMICTNQLLESKEDGVLWINKISMEDGIVYIDTHVKDMLGY